MSFVGGGGELGCSPLRLLVHAIMPRPGRRRSLHGRSRDLGLERALRHFVLLLLPCLGGDGSLLALVVLEQPRVYWALFFPLTARRQLRNAWLKRAFRHLSIDARLLSSLLPLL